MQSFSTTKVFTYVYAQSKVPYYANNFRHTVCWTSGLDEEAAHAMPPLSDTATDFSNLRMTSRLITYANVEQSLGYRLEFFRPRLCRTIEGQEGGRGTPALISSRGCEGINGFSISMTLADNAASQVKGCEGGRVARLALSRYLLGKTSVRLSFIIYS